MAEAVDPMVPADDRRLRVIYERYHGRMDTLVLNADGRAQLALDLGLLIGLSARLIDERQELQLALEALVQLQAHYAKLLNLHDGGERRSFCSAEEWLARMREMDAEERHRG